MLAIVSLTSELFDWSEMMELLAEPPGVLSSSVVCLLLHLLSLFAALSLSSSSIRAALASIIFSMGERYAAVSMGKREDPASADANILGRDRANFCWQGVG